MRLVADQDALLAGMPGARVVVTESLPIGNREVAASGGALRIEVIPEKAGIQKTL
ncbi:MAG: hypothetical protein HYY78_21070 [Betaproteobacteria bacterium]|nr:hypothetical protein [Betaproteobacteria bacterium]